MPALQTITSFYTFNANTKARAAQVNQNFSAFRGHLLAMNPAAVAFVDNTYDLGSGEYYWRAGYFGTNGINLKSNTTTAGDHRIVGDTTTNALRYKVGTTSGQHEFLVGGATSAVHRFGDHLFYDSAGSLVMRQNVPYQQCTTSAAISQFAKSTEWAPFVASSTVVNIAGSTITVQTLGRPIEIRMCSGINITAGSTYVGVISNPSDFRISLLKNGATLSSSYFETSGQVPMSFSWVDPTPVAGAHNYSVSIVGRTAGTLAVGQAFLLGREMK